MESYKDLWILIVFATATLLWMIGLTKTAVLSDIGIEALFYVEELCRVWGLTDEQRTIVNFYAAIHALNFIGAANDKGKH